MSREFISISFSQLNPQQIDLLTGLLSEMEYEGFEETGDGLQAFIPSEKFEEELLQELSQSLNLAWQKKRVKEENWNAIWESSFEPVVIPGKVAVRAHFHPPVEGVEHEIVITPKMSFGTGHHATTWLMMDIMTTQLFQGKRVLDFGTGTGILAILAEKLGASPVLGIDNDPWCIENARENLDRNHCSRVEVELGHLLPNLPPFDIVLANINKNFLLENREELAALVSPGGTLLVSGVLSEDLQELEKAYFPLMGKPVLAREKNNWAALAFVKGGSN